MNRIQLLALSGSLRKKSYNTALLEALRRLAPESVEIMVYSPGALPLFNPDMDDADLPAVEHLRDNLRRADGLIIASPEYAHGIAGVLKNALDWLVSCESFVGIPVALFNTSPRASHAQAALREVIKTMSGMIVEKASIAVPLLSSNLDADGIAAHPNIAPALQKALEQLCLAIRNSEQ